MGQTRSVTAADEQARISSRWPRSLKKRPGLRMSAPMWRPSSSTVSARACACNPTRRLSMGSSAVTANRPIARSTNRISKRDGLQYLHRQGPAADADCQSGQGCTGRGCQPLEDTGSLFRRRWYGRPTSSPRRWKITMPTSNAGASSSQKKARTPVQSPLMVSRTIAAPLPPCLRHTTEKEDELIFAAPYFCSGARRSLTCTIGPCPLDFEGILDVNYRRLAWYCSP